MSDDDIDELLALPIIVRTRTVSLEQLEEERTTMTHAHLEVHERAFAVVAELEYVLGQMGTANPMTPGVAISLNQIFAKSLEAIKDTVQAHAVATDVPGWTTGIDPREHLRQLRIQERRDNPLIRILIIDDNESES